MAFLDSVRKSNPSFTGFKWTLEYQAMQVGSAFLFSLPRAFTAS
jgi:hypothetical protein